MWLAFLDGRTERLFNGMDFRAEVCGNGKFTNKHYLYFMTPTIDINVAMCVHKCPNATVPLPTKYSHLY
jgi:hypothetical protein